MNKKAKTFSKIKNIILNCDRCGSCTTVCPLFAVSSKEKAAARGKIALTRLFIEDDIKSNKELKQALDYCLLCKACTEVCPSKILTDEAMIEARQYLAEDIGTSFFHKLVGFTMANNTLVRLGGLGINFARKLKIDRALSGLIPSQNSSRIYQSMVAGPSAIVSNNKKDNSNIDFANIKEIYYFKGCAIKMFFPEVAKDTVNILKKGNKKVAVPESVCCGLPHTAHGMMDKAKELAKRNIELFKDADLIVVDCASCGSMLKEYVHRLKDDEQWAEKARLFSEKVIGLSEYLNKIGYIPEYKESLKVTYHDPCHLNRGQGINKEPRELLKKACNYVELPAADQCCGGAGTFQYEFPNESKKVLQMKIDNIKSTGANIVVTECPSCMMQLSKGEKKGNFKVMHISQVL